MQFHIEACVLSILGGLLGLGLSALGLRNLRARGGYDDLHGSGARSSRRWPSASSSAWVFGSYPAAKASKMTPDRRAASATDRRFAVGGDDRRNFHPSAAAERIRRSACALQNRKPSPRIRSIRRGKQIRSPLAMDCRRGARCFGGRFLTAVPAAMYNNLSAKGADRHAVYLPFHHYEKGTNLRYNFYIMRKKLITTNGAGLRHYRRHADADALCAGREPPSALANALAMAALGTAVLWPSISLPRSCASTVFTSRKS